MADETHVASQRVKHWSRWVWRGLVGRPRRIVPSGSAVSYAGRKEEKALLVQLQAQHMHVAASSSQVWTVSTVFIGGHVIVVNAVFGSRQQPLWQTAALCLFGASMSGMWNVMHRRMWGHIQRHEHRGCRGTSPAVSSEHAQRHSRCCVHRGVQHPQRHAPRVPTSDLLVVSPADVVCERGVLSPHPRRSTLTTRPRAYVGGVVIHATCDEV